jgi:hypothetical protein
MGAVEVTPNQDLQAGTGAPAALLGELQHHAAQPHGVIWADRARLFVTEDRLEVHSPERDKRRDRVSRGPAELRIEGGHELVPQVTVGGRQHPDAGHPQLVDQPVLQRAIDALAPAPRLGGVAQDVLDPQPAAP